MSHRDLATDILDTRTVKSDQQVRRRMLEELSEILPLAHLDDSGQREDPSMAAIYSVLAATT